MANTGNIRITLGWMITQIDTTIAHVHHIVGYTPIIQQNLLNRDYFFIR